MKLDWLKRKLWNRRALDHANVKHVTEIITPKFVRSSAVEYSPEHYERRRMAKHRRLEVRRHRG